MRQLVPHVRQAFDVAKRLKGASDTNTAFERTLDWLADGAALLGADGTVLFANEAFHAIARRNDGIRLRKGTIEFSASEVRDRLQAARILTASQIDEQKRLLTALRSQSLPAAWGIYRVACEV